MSARLATPLLTALAMLASAAPATARSLQASGSGYSVRLQGEYGESLPAYYQGGRTWVLGRWGQRYNVIVTNNTGQRVEAVVTVDGRDVLSGGSGDYVRQRGYIVAPYGTVKIEGFRQSMSNVASFRFTDPGDSYAGRRGTPQNIGVVGVAVFREQRPHRRPRAVAPPPPRPPVYWGYNEDSGSAKAPRAEASPRPAKRKSGRGRAAAGEPAADALGAGAYNPGTRNNIGTQYGESRYSPVVEVPFRRRRQSRPDHVLAVYYDDAQGLASRGIDVYPHFAGDPSPFPPRRFAPPPR